MRSDESRGFDVSTETPEQLAVHEFNSLRNPSRKSNKNDTSVDSRGSEFAERHYSVAEVARSWNLSKDFVRRIFDKEPGVLIFEDARPSRSKRRYRTLRVPQYVLDRV